ncbi:putative multidrug resistance ABC transporter ATP-binding/permease protein YheI [Jeotgalibaca dankookensis]|uniref:Putative multidrug resistance ABC transporter ATP-binding/permease protein YheI n=2 Tax=Jeotgalibaca dankookensis TaxID=708126 RepID=A0A1S6IQP6_9LACT|nr:putative multidrug resistance ABC transporter ATP-binding/permease protein YheI [Jeotgalibaca dankookensis]
MCQMFNVILKLKTFFSRNKKRYIISFFTMIASNIFSVLIPYIIGRMIDSIVKKQLTSLLLFKYTGAFLLSLIAAYLFEYIWSYYLFTGSAKLQRDMRLTLMQHFLRMRASFYEKFRVGDLMARATQDVRAISDTVGYGMMVLMNATLFLTTIIATMGVSVSWTMTLLSLFPLIFLAYLFGKVGNMVEERYTIAQKSFSELNNDVLEVVDGTRLIRAYAKETVYLEKFQKQTESMLKKNNQVAKANALFAPLVKIFITLSNVIGFGYGAYLVSRQNLSVGDMIAFQMYLGMIVWPIISIGELTNVLRQGSASMIRVEEVLNQGDDMEEKGSKVIASKKDIVINDLSFQYPTSTNHNLKNIEVIIPKGKTLGIVGKTGSGKTTLLRQFLRQYPLGEGEFKYGTDSVLNYQPTHFQSLIGYVPQDHILFSRSVRENIAFGKEGASDQEIMESVKIASFEEDLAKMDQGLDTVIGEKGVSISGGQKQRISIARALIKNPDILILDDSLSAVDAKTEQKIIANIQNERAGKTTIISTHRLSAVRRADEIIVLEDGRIIERGTHLELLEKKGWYYTQYLRQELKEGDEE